MDHQANTLAIFCTIGGLVGYVRKNSLPSLVGGLTVGAVYGVAGYLIRENRTGGIESAVLASILLLGGSLPRAIKVRKPVPIVLSTVATVSLGYYAKKWADFNL